MNCDIVLFKSLFENDKRYILIFDNNKNLLWSNNAAKNRFIVLPSFSSINFNNNNSDKNECNMITESGTIFGSCYNSSDIIFFIFEPQFTLDEKSISEYVDDCDVLLRCAISGISSSTEMLNELMENGESSGGVYLNSIIKNCCSLMRIQEYNRQLKASANNNIKLTFHSLRLLLNEIVNECSELIKNGKITVSEIEDCIISTNKNTFVFLILNQIRTMLIADPNKCQAEILVYINDENVQIVLKNNHIPEFIPASEYFNAELYMSECEAKAINAKVGHNSLFTEFTVSLLKSNEPPSGILTFEMNDTDNKYIHSKWFSPYNIMLGDLSDNRKFY